MSRRKKYDTQGMGVEGDDHPLHRRGGGLAYSKNSYTPKNIHLSNKQNKQKKEILNLNKKDQTYMYI